MAVLSGDQIIIDRDYVDNYAMKKFTENELMGKYFDTNEVSDLSIGMIGLTTEQITNFTEDNFNMASVLIRETFPNRAQIPESIYSHGAIFQITNVFSQAASCSFYLVLMEDDILEYANFPTGSGGIGYFYIDKNTQILVENIPFTFDYDIQIQIQKRTNEDGLYDYVYSASYVMNDYKNSISDINIPYIRMRKTIDGYIAMEVTMHQCTREQHFEEIVNNSTINYPTIKLEFENKLAGFDVIYKDPDTGIRTQLEKKIIYSVPSKEPFCFYQMTDEGKLNISFTSRDTYFQPKFNSELEIILYLTEGADGNFQKYTGTDISIIYTNNNYEYNGSFRMVTKTVGGAEGGADQLSLEALQNLSVEGYRTALALTTEPDLQYFFKNYKYRYGNEILFIKKRNDVAERIFTAFLIMKRNDMIYKTNTKDIAMNLYDMTPSETSNTFIIEPGKLFVYKENSYDIDFYRDSEKEKKYHEEYLKEVENGTATFNPNDKNPPTSLVGRPISFAEWKRNKGYDDELTVFDFTEEELEKIEEKERFLFLNPFLIRFIKQPNLVSLYLTYIDQDFELDFIKHNVETIKQFIMYKINIKRTFTKDKKYTLTISLLPSSTTTEEMIEVINDPYSVSKNKLRIVASVMDDEKETCFFELTPTTLNEDVVTFTTELFTNDYITSDNKIRILNDVTYRNPVNGEYYKLINEDDHEFYNLYDENDNIIESNITANMIKNILNCSDYIYRSMNEDFCYGEYYKKNPSSTGLGITYNHYDKTDKLINTVSEESIIKYISTDIYWSSSFAYYYIKNLNTNEYEEYSSDGTKDSNTYTETDIEYMLSKGEVVHAPFVQDTLYRKRVNAYNMKNTDRIYIPMYDAKLEITTLYYDPSESLPASNKFEKIDPSLAGYRVANIYSTSESNVTFVKPLDNIRCMLDFKDYLYKSDEKYLYDMFDLEISSIPLIYYKNIFDDDNFSYFLRQFFSHYNFIKSIAYDRLRNITTIDTKFFNTYGKSKNFIIGEQDEIFDTVNIELEFNVWVMQGTDKIAAERELKNFIKTDVETINEEVSNNLYISNLIRKIENNFAYVDHLRFIRINDYNSEYQTVKNLSTDLEKMTKEELRKYVPEILVCDLNKITLNIFEI